MSGLSYSSEKLVDMDDYVSTISSNTDLVFVVLSPVQLLISMLIFSVDA